MGFEASLQNVLDQATLKWVFVGGKGGVGKTTTSCSLAVAAAAVRKSVLLVSTDPAHNISDAFGQKFRATPTPVRGVANLFGMEISSGEALGKAGSLAEGRGGSGPVSVGKLFESLGDFFGEGGAVPGMDELVTFGQMLKLIRERDFDLVVFDTAPTGHTLRLLALPDAATRALGAVKRVAESSRAMLQPLLAPMGVDDAQFAEMLGFADESLGLAGAVADQFRDAALTTFVCVAIPEFLALYETERLVQQLAALGMDCRNIVVNFVLDADAASPCEMCRARAAMQRKYLDQFAELYADFHLTLSPLRNAEVRGVALLRAFAEQILVPHRFVFQE
eukprot:gnl/Chilomastix_cuspidata/2064.p4 GENE.gnl/Chilomastix_cuspidata/2064~~gnl/Chilomastix_cuspidata/2064.p4  ORF type:complete len:335 (+),score=196.58 gnl/Chilomastix_cuspidata/2064:179-1183(+)